MRLLPGTLLLALCLTATGTPARSFHGSAGDNPFIAAMRTMMRLMGLLDEDPYPWLNPFLASPGAPAALPGTGAWTPGALPYGASIPGAGWPGQSAMMGMPGLAGGVGAGLPSTLLSPYFRQSQSWMRQAWPAGDPSSDPDSLEGKWRGRNGEWLVIGRGMFRLYVSRDEYVQGDERHTDRYISFRNNDNQLVKSYEYAIRDGRMVLRDEDGKLLLFKKQS